MYNSSGGVVSSLPGSYGNLIVEENGEGEILSATFNCIGRVAHCARNNGTSVTLPPNSNEPMEYGKIESEEIVEPFEPFE